LTKPLNPLFSFNARGGLGSRLSFRRRGQQTIAEKTPVPKDAKTSAQLAWRTMYQKCTDLWHTLSDLEQQSWESQARRQHMTGYAYYMSLCLRPNPGIYLPLAGGTMQGAVDMAGNKVLNLPVPGADEEPTRKVDLASAISVHADSAFGVHSFDKSCRVTSSVSQTIPHNLLTTISFDVERWDTDSMHDNVLNNGRLTCKTAGKYLIAALAYFAPNAAGMRSSRILLNGITSIASSPFIIRPDLYAFVCITSLWNMSVNDYVVFQVSHSAGVPLDILSLSAYTPEFMMVRIP